MNGKDSYSLFTFQLPNQSNVPLLSGWRINVLRYTTLDQKYTTEDTSDRLMLFYVQWSSWINKKNKGSLAVYSPAMSAKWKIRLRFWRFSEKTVKVSYNKKLSQSFIKAKYCISSLERKEGKGGYKTPWGDFVGGCFFHWFPTKAAVLAKCVQKPFCQGSVRITSGTDTGPGSQKLICDCFKNTPYEYFLT